MMTVIRELKIKISPWKVYRLLGYDTNQQVPKKIGVYVKRSINYFHSVMDPQALYVERGVKRMDNDTVVLREDITLRSTHLTRAIKKCDKVILFLVTVGEKLEREISTLMKKKKMTEAYILDAIGSVAVEEAAASLQAMIDKDLETQHKRTSIRFSPGYCDWKLEEQKKIFQVLDNHLIDVNLSASCLMSPRKSVSGIFGIGDSMYVDRTITNPCKLCTLQDCKVRRK
ncbi:MAG: vitamin B12 dependent-methionine synthase activation domain-containing protein [bacterium]